MKHIVIINGFHSGKDTFVKYCKKYAECDNYSYVDKTRELLSHSHIGYKDTMKDDKDRKLLATVNNALEEWDNIPLKSVYDKCFCFICLGNKNKVLFIHIRNIDIIQKLIGLLHNMDNSSIILKYCFPKDFKITTLLVRRNNGLTAPTKEDADVENYNYDYYIDNNGTLDELELKAKDFIEKLRKEE